MKHFKVVCSVPLSTIGCPCFRGLLTGSAVVPLLAVWPCARNGRIVQRDSVTKLHSAVMRSTRRVERSVCTFSDFLPAGLLMSLCVTNTPVPRGSMLVLDASIYHVSTCSILASSFLVVFSPCRYLAACFSAPLECCVRLEHDVESAATCVPYSQTCMYASLSPDLQPNPLIGHLFWPHLQQRQAL